MCVYIYTHLSKDLTDLEDEDDDDDTEHHLLELTHDPAKHNYLRSRLHLLPEDCLLVIYFPPPTTTTK